MKPPHVGQLHLMICIFLVATFVAQGLAAVHGNSQAYDEGGHIAAGVFLPGSPRLSPLPGASAAHPRMVRLPLYLIDRLPFALRPGVVGAEGARGGDVDDWPAVRLRQSDGSGPPPALERIVTVSRLPNLALGALLVVLIGRWAYRLWGPWSAVLAMALGRLRSQSPRPLLDCRHRYRRLPVHAAGGVPLLGVLPLTPRASVDRRAGLAAGLALTAKFSLHCSCCRSSVVCWPAPSPSTARFSGESRASRFPRQRRLAAQAVVMVVVVTITAALPFALAYSTFQGLADWIYGAETAPSSSRRRVIRPFSMANTPGTVGGRITPSPSSSRRRWGRLVLILAGLLLVRRGQPLTLRDALFLLLPVAGFWVAVEKSHVDVGVRYLLPTLPFLFVLTGRSGDLASAADAWLVPVAASGLVAAPTRFPSCASAPIP